jgi:hypothetical protein
LLWCDAEDLRYAPLVERKQRLRALLPESDRLFLCDYIEQHGTRLFDLCCERDLEGIVAKRKGDPYIASTSWFKIRNAGYTQWEGRHELFEREREADPACAAGTRARLRARRSHEDLRNPRGSKLRR